jgi:hypothetical protein
VPITTKGVLDSTLCDKVCQLLTTFRVFFGHSHHFTSESYCLCYYGSWDWVMWYFYTKFTPTVVFWYNPYTNYNITLCKNKIVWFWFYGVYHHFQQYLTYMYISIEEYSDTYALKVCGCDLFLLEEHPLSQYKVGNCC